ncbi:MAG TPA: LysR substrate-binding domain-containing protein [Myxococcota bacterium]|nr:LysR substrate-binding domain-containing protein [Myxococcota bacterium]
MRPTLRQLEYAVAIADHGSFHRAARACHVTQPGLSAQVAQLESLLELRLFERGPRKVLVTPAGEALVRRARALLRDADELVDAARAYTRPLSGTLRLGAIPTVAPYLLPRVLPRLRRAYPQLALQLREDTTRALLARLSGGSLDVLLLALEAPLGDVESLPLFRDDFVLATPPGHRLARRRRVREADLDGEDVLLLEDGHCLREQALSFCQSAGAREPSDFRASSLGTLVQMVSSGAGVTLLPRLAEAIETRHADLAIVPFARPAPYRTIGLVWRRSTPRATEYRELGKRIARTGALHPQRKSSGKSPKAK